jgi:hypothetical protein
VRKCERDDVLVCMRECDDPHDARGLLLRRQGHAAAGQLAVDDRFGYDALGRVVLGQSDAARRTDPTVWRRTARRRGGLRGRIPRGESSPSLPISNGPLPGRRSSSRLADVANHLEIDGAPNWRPDDASSTPSAGYGPASRRRTS